MFHFWSEDNKWLRNKKWSFIIKSSRVKYTRILDPHQIAFDVNDPSGIFPGPFFARVRLNFSEKVKIASYSLFWWAEAWLGRGRHFPNYTRLVQTPPPANCAHYYPCYCLNFFIRFLYQLLILSSVLIGETSFALLWECSCCWLLLLLAWSWLVVCQHLTKHRQSFSHSLPRPSFPYVLLRLQYVSSPREKMS